MNGYFLVSKNPEIDYDIRCELHPTLAQKEIPREQRQLVPEIEYLSDVIRGLQDSVNKEEYINKLLSLAQVGLVGNTAQPKLAREQLDVLKEEILRREGIAIKNKHLEALGVRALIGAIIVFLVYILVYFSFKQTCPYFLVAIGTMAGLWISFAVRKIRLELGDLITIEKDGLKPIVKLIYMSIISVFVVLFFKSGLISLKIGNLNIESLDSNVEFQLLLGVMIGLLENKLAIDLLKKTTNLFSSSKKSD